MPLSRGERRWAWVGAAALALALGAGLYFSWSRLRDRQVASEVEAELARALKALPADDPITRRYGSFERLEGEGFVRRGHAIGSGWVPIIFSRKAVFSQAHVHLAVLVYPGKNLEVEALKMFPDEAEASRMKSSLHEGEIWFSDGPGQNERSMLHVRMSHPRCPAN